MHRAFTSISLFVLAFACGCQSDEDYIHPRTPHNVARMMSDLSVPDSAVVTKFVDHFLKADGESVKTQGALELTLRLDSATVLTMLRQADSLGYANGAAPGTDSSFLASFGEANVPGRFRVQYGRSTKMNYIFVVVDSLHRELRIQKSRMTGAW